MNKIVLISVSLILALVVGLFSCATYAAPRIPQSLALLVPQTANLIAKVEIKEILNDGDFGYLYEEFAAKTPDQPQTINKALDLVRYESGIDLRDFTEAVVFANTFDLVDLIDALEFTAPYSGVLLRGVFSEESFIENIEQRVEIKFETYSYKGVKIYTYRQMLLPAFGLTFVDDQLIVAGSASAVEDVVDIMVGDKQPITGAIYELYETLGDALFKLAATVPNSLARQIPELDLQGFREVDRLGFSFSKTGSTIMAELELYTVYADSPSLVIRVNELAWWGRLWIDWASKWW